MFHPTRRQWLQTLVGSFASAVVPACGSDQQRAETGEDVDVCVVGSGPAGAVLASRLVAQGIKVLLIEGGPLPGGRPKRNDFEPVLISGVEPIRYPIEHTRFLGDGGTSNLWDARCPRLQPFDFDAANPYVEKDALWPIRYDDIEPYYEKAEQELGIRGGVNSRYSPPRKTALPVDERPAPCVHKLLGRSQWVAEVCPVAYNSRMAKTHLPRVTETGGQFLRNTRVVGVRTAPGGRVVGLEGRQGSLTTSIRARFFVLACGGIETPRLLLQSRTKEFPDGVGNDFDQVGRHFMEHIWLEIGTIQLRAPNPCEGLSKQDLVSWQFYQALKKQGLGAAIFEFTYSPSESVLRISAVIEMKSLPSNRVELAQGTTDPFGSSAAELKFRISDHERATWAEVQAIGRRVAQSLKSGALREGNGEIGWCHHHMGTCRMGRDPRTSVIDQDLKVHGTENLYVVGSAPFVTAGAGSPTLLITALSVRLAEHLASRAAAAR